MKYFIIIALLFFTINLQSQDIYLNTFGDSTDHPIIYLHGGPGGSCLLIEKLVAPQLAEKGFFVIVYDRRGDGRSGIFEEQKLPLKYQGPLRTPIEPEKPNLQTSFEELDIIIERFNLQRPTLLGHSFGGAIATLYADSFPNKVNAIILSGAPIDIQATSDYILQASKEAFKIKGDTEKVAWIEFLEERNPKGSIVHDYLALESGYAPELHLNKAAKRIDSIQDTDSLVVRMNPQVVASFGQHSPIVEIDFLRLFKGLKDQGIEVYGLYGKSDFRYPPFLIEELKDVVGRENVLYMDQCGHATLLHRRSTAIQQIEEWIK